MKKNKITKTEFIERFNEINNEYKLISKNMKNLIKKSETLENEGEDLYIESEGNVFTKPSFKSLPKMMNKLNEIITLSWYL